MPDLQSQMRGGKETHLTEDLWIRISEHMTLREWYKAASTCKTSYNVPLKWAKLIRKHPLEGVHCIVFIVISQQGAVLIQRWRH